MSPSLILYMTDEIIPPVGINLMVFISFLLVCFLHNTGSFTGTGDATAALMLAWVHLLTQQSAHINSNDTSNKEEEAEGMKSPVSAALLNSLATVKVCN